ncbi:hypothetical protein Q7C_1623 [Methylophaga frappieri]|uniref:histidine kinase n=1 Tax=Methylophaga frappieri (strain ATCC BAA-2434 / DSM 25690 / JAM7) TaxID=754477 RepID=I1YIM8_METFJ|nr:PAS domain S-box protein [Methylophaga frappieri]AFJ02771.1 hypothetical protein Q7C_1623 [Methylophaga frappieri]
MQWLETFFVTESDQLAQISGVYNYDLVVLSIIVASVASFIALHFASMSRAILVSSHRHLAIMIGAAIMAGGVWSMHFVGMLAYNMGSHVGYDTTLTLLSIIPVLVAAYIALKMLQKSHLTLWQLIISSVCVGAGIGIMHYTGMAAMQMHVSLQYDPLLFGTSIIVAVILAFIALSARYYLRLVWQHISMTKVNGISAVIMGLAISGMHYTGMAAARYVVTDETVVAHAMQNEHLQLSYIVAFTTLLISILTAALASQLRYRQLLIEKTANERRLQTMMETAVDGILTVDANGIIRDFNRSAIEIFGWQSDEIIGQPFLKLVPDDAQAEFHDYLTSFQQTNTTQLSGQARETFAKHKQGHTFPIRLGVGHINLSEVGSMFVGFVTDISQRWAMEEQLRKSEEKFSSLVKNIPGASFRCLIDANWTAIFVSDAIYDLTGWHPDDFYNKRIELADVIHPDDVAKTNQAVQVALDTKSNYSIEFRYNHRDGRTLWVLEHGSIIWENEEPVWIDGLILDITDRVEMEDNLRKAKVKAEISAESKAQFLANMSHEIRTPMNAIIGFTNVLIDADDMPEGNRGHLQTISQSASSLLHLLNDILDSAKLEKNKLELDETTFDLTRLVDSVISTLWLQAKHKGLYLNFELPDNIHTAYRGDENRLRQVLINIIGNAIKFTEQGGVNLSVSINAQQHICFSIEDTGIGMDSATLDKVFEPFSQADASMSRRFGGTGLGTTISKQLVELMGGKLQASSEPGIGSRFYFALPLKKTQLDPGKVAENQLIHLLPKRVLIADDIQQNLTLLTLILERQKHIVIQAENGEQALDIFKKSQPDIILMDLQMPVMDGFTATKMIRIYEAENQLTPTPIVALTASVLSEDKIEAKLAGMDGFAHKPIDIRALNVEMARVLGLLDETIETAEALNKNKVTSTPNINLEHGTALWGDEATYLHEIGRFWQQHHDIVDTLTTLCETKDWSALRSTAHKLKGLSGNLGLTKIYHCAVQMEQYIAKQNSEKTLADIESLRVAMGLFHDEMSSLSQAINQSQNMPNSVESLNADALQNLLTSLTKMAQLGEVDEELIQQLVKGVPADLHRTASAVQTALDDFDFNGAQDHLAVIQARLANES